jgi:Arc/MetJ family transcription regulator
MKTTIDIPDDILEDAMQAVGAATKREAVLVALRELNRRHRMAKLVRFSATCDFQANAALEEGERGEGSSPAP